MEGEPKTGLARWWRIAFWPAIVVLALNIETVTQGYGGDKLLAWIISRGGPMIAAIASAVQSDSALYAALLLAGGGLYAWTEYLWKKWPKREFDEWANLAGLLRNLSEIIMLAPRKKWVAKAYTAISEEMVAVDLPPLPDFDSGDPSALYRASMYVKVITPLVRVGEIEVAREIGALTLSRLAEPIEPQSLPDTEEETRL